MATSKEYLDFILEQLSGLEEITYRKMMGEYILYYRGKIIGGIYDHRLLLKPVSSIVAQIDHPCFECPYEGAKEMLLIKDVENKAFLQELLLKMYDELPSPKKKREKIVIKKVNQNTKLSKQLLSFVETFSWEEVREHTFELIKQWNFSDWETPFVAMMGNRIVGMATIMKTDYYPLSDIYPWISTIFVEEEYRGNRISGKLIDYANQYAKQVGFKQTYIPSECAGLYEKYGYCYLKDIVNYGQGVDRLYRKELE